MIAVLEFYLRDASPSANLKERERDAHSISITGTILHLIKTIKKKHTRGKKKDDLSSHLRKGITIHSLVLRKLGEQRWPRC